MHINSSIKDRILDYLDYKCISQYQCYGSTGITRGVFAQKFGLSEENLLKFLNFYTEVDPTWLVTGNGNMLIDKKTDERINSTVLNSDVHLQEVKEIEKGMYTDAFVEQLLIDHSKLTDSHQKLSDAHYLLVVDVTERNKIQREKKAYTQDNNLGMVAEDGNDYKKEK